MFIAFGYKSEFIGIFSTREKAQERISHVYRDLATLSFEGDCVRFSAKPNAHTSWGEPRTIIGIHGSITLTQVDPNY